MLLPCQNIWALNEACKSQISQVIHETLLAMDLQYLTISNQAENYNKGKVGERTSFSTWDKEGQLLSQNCSCFAMELGKSQTLKLLKSVLDSSMGVGGKYQPTKSPWLLTQGFGVEEKGGKGCGVRVLGEGESKTLLGFQGKMEDQNPFLSYLFV